MMTKNDLRILCDYYAKTMNDKDLLEAARTDMAIELAAATMTYMGYTISPDGTYILDDNPEEPEEIRELTLEEMPVEEIYNLIEYTDHKDEKYIIELLRRADMLDRYNPDGDNEEAIVIAVNKLGI